jgi:hypothetical protein
MYIYRFHQHNIQNFIILMVQSSMHHHHHHHYHIQFVFIHWCCSTLQQFVGTILILFYLVTSHITYNGSIYIIYLKYHSKTITFQNFYQITSYKVHVMPSLFQTVFMFSWQ